MFSLLNFDFHQNQTFYQEISYNEQFKKRQSQKNEKIQMNYFENVKSTTISD